MQEVPMTFEVARIQRNLQEMMDMSILKGLLDGKEGGFWQKNNVKALGHLADMFMSAR